MNEWECEWQPTERNQRLHELATRYHVECEAYDQTVCTGSMGQDGIMPATPHEMALINRNAHAVRNRLAEEAQRVGIGREELTRAIGKWLGGGELTSSEQPACPNCKECQTVCACLRNTCFRCGSPVGNITFTVCDACWDAKPPNVPISGRQRP